MSFLFRYLRFHDIIGGIHVPVDDGVDKLNRKYTLLVFLFLALPIFTKQYIGDPIECFAPVYFAEHQSRYINSYCWTQSTYYMVPIGDPEDDGDQQEPPDRIMPDEVDYFIGFETVTHIGNERLRRVRVSYYQWAPLILLVQGLCFYIPFLIWNSCANNAGVKLRRLLKKASDIASLPPGCQQREALLAEFVDQFHTLVTGEAGWCADLQCGNGGYTPGSSSSSSASGSSGSQQSGGPPGTSGGGPAVAGRSGGGGGQRGGDPRGGGGQQQQDDSTGDGRGGHHRGGGHGGQTSGCCLVGIPFIGSLLGCCLKPCTSFGLVGPSKYLCLLYLAVKSAYVFNVGLQFFLLGQFLGRGYLKHGLELINRLIVNGDWWASPRFPLSTLCQVRADMSGGLRSYTCQCVLPINVFNEKIFSVVWFYMAFLMPLNVLSLLFWIYRTFETNRLSYIRLCLWRTRLVELNQIHRTVRRLSQSYLGWDGVFLLRLIEHNHGSIMATLIMSRLWEFYANQMKLQEDANQLALANNAQHTLSNTTTAISNQHQLLAAAAAAAAAANQIGPGPGGGGGHSHGPGGGGHSGHGHGPPLMPAQHQQQIAAGPGGPHFGGVHGPPGGGQHSGHAHGGHAQHGAPHSAFSGVGPHGVGPQQMAPMVPHGPHAHHSGQISGQPGHHPLHAANTHHNHHAIAGHHVPGPHLSGPFTGASNASILAQLQQQHSHTGGVGNTVSAGQSHGAGAGSQQSASGNVAAAVAALAAAAAANSTNQQSAPGQVVVTTSGTHTSHPQNQSSVSTTVTNNNSSSTGQQQQVATGNGGGGNSSTATIGQINSVAPPISNATNAQPQSMHSHHPIHLHSLMQQASPGGGSAVNNNQPGCSVAPGSQQASAIQTPSNSQTGARQQQQSAMGMVVPNSTASSSSSSGQQSAAAASQGQSTTTTSFITAANSTQQQQPGPPLPPPPPAHVVAAVAAAASGSSSNPVAGGAQSSNVHHHSVAPGMVRAGVGAVGSVAGPQAAASAASTTTTMGRQQQQQQTTTSSGGGGPQVQVQPTPPPHTNPVLFNLKSSSIQAAANGARYSPHTIKRT